MDSTFVIFSVIILIMSAAFHEYMHAWAADQLGDHTARDLGRLTINPLAHLDWFGSIFLPLLLIISGVNFVFGYAKPVPFNPYNLRDAKWGPAKVAVAGPLANLILAVIFGFVLRFTPGLNPAIGTLLSYVVIINLVLMIFNLMPIPPLDGSKIVMPFLPYYLQQSYARLERYGMFLVILFMMLGLQIVWVAVSWLFRLIVGG